MTGILFFELVWFVVHVLVCASIDLLQRSGFLYHVVVTGLRTVFRFYFLCGIPDDGRRRRVRRQVVVSTASLVHGATFNGGRYRDDAVGQEAGRESGGMMQLLCMMLDRFIIC